MSASEGFLLDPHGAMLFFRVCRRYKIEGYEERLKLIRCLTKRGTAKYLRDVSEFTKGKKVLKITKRNDNDN